MTGKTILLAIVFFILSGGSACAQEKLLPVTSRPNPKTINCTLLQDFLVTSENSCEEKRHSQIEIAVKAQAKTFSDTPVEFSYATEPTYFVPPTPIPEQPQTAVLGEQTTTTVTPTPEEQAQTPVDNVPADSANLNSDLIFQLINQHRTDIGKPAFQKDEALCTLAKTRSLELHDELFVNGNLHSGLYNRNLPYWITEDAKWGSNEAGTVDWWLHSPIHRAAIEGDYTYSCGACNGSMCSQLFTSYTPKQTVAVVTPTPQAIAENK